MQRNLRVAVLVVATLVVLVGTGVIVNLQNTKRQLPPVQTASASESTPVTEVATTSPTSTSTTVMPATTTSTTEPASTTTVQPTTTVRPTTTVLRPTTTVATTVPVTRPPTTAAPATAPPTTTMAVSTSNLPPVGTKEYFQALPKCTYISINLTTQQLRADCGEVGTFLVNISSGAEATPTLADDFYVQGHGDEGWQEGPLGKMYYPFFYDGNYGIHGGTLPGYPASHGCVRIPMDIAEELYYRVPDGTPVHIHGQPNF